jgi:cytochrome c oxidase assembly protein subunit 15
MSKLSVAAPSKAFHGLALFTLFVGFMLIWWGAAVTTDHAGMAFSDWPLSNGSINPKGWIHITPWMLEHGHRLWGESVGSLVLIMFWWQWLKAGLPKYQAVLLTVTFMALFPIVHAADALTKGIDNKLVALVRSFGLSAPILWATTCATMGGAAVWAIRGARGTAWPTLVKLTAIAGVVVETQALLGGLRVLEVSDRYGIIHGCLGQLFYCVLITIAIMSSSRWAKGRMIISSRARSGLIWLSSLLFLAVFLQLVFGAIIRHTHRFDLAAPDVITTGGDLVPWGRSFDLVALFTHKAWALVVFVLALMTSAVTWKLLMRQGLLKALPIALLLLPVAQLTLGVFVILTVKSFWVTNIHVINGLLILATAFVLALNARCSLTEADLRGEIANR